MGDEELARLFHETYERLAPSFGYTPREETSVPWEEVPEPNKSLMIAVASVVGESLRATVAALEAERDAAFMALNAYGRHGLLCGYVKRGEACDCGFTVALAAAPSTPPSDDDQPGGE